MDFEVRTIIGFCGSSAVMDEPEKTKRSKRKKKVPESSENPANAEKHVLYLPGRETTEPFPELHLDFNKVKLIDARKFSLAIAHSNASNWREFLRVELPSEKYASGEYYLETGPTVECLLAKPLNKGPWMLYRSYTRADELTVLDYKESKLYYLQFMPQDLLSEEKDLSLQYITDWLSIAYIMRNELERRRIGTSSFGGGKRLTMTDLKISPLQHTHRKAVANEQKKNFKIWPMMIAEAAEDIGKSVRLRLLYFENILRFTRMYDNYNDFRMRNKNWMDERLKCADMFKQIITGKKHVESLNRLRPFKSVYHLASELHEVAPAVGHSVFLCRALKDLCLGVEQSETVRKVVIDSAVPLRVCPSRYEYGPSAVTAYDENCDLIEPLELSFHRPPSRAPSVNSLSGFSSESAASTATESPGDWQHNWKMQTMHKDMEHRLMDTSIQNPLEERELGELEAAQRIANEVDRRVAMLNGYQSFEKIVGGKNSDILRLCYSAAEQTKLRRDIKVAKQVKKRLKTLRKLCDDLDSGDVLGLQLIDYVYNETLKMLPESEKDPYDGLAINDAWKTLIDSGALKNESKEALKTMFSSHNSWVNACSISQKNIIPRCDQLPHEGITEAEYSNVSIPWMLLCAGICLACAILITVMVAL